MSNDHAYTLLRLTINYLNINMDYNFDSFANYCFTAYDHRPTCCVATNDHNNSVL